MNEQSPSTIQVMPVHDTTRIVNWLCTCQSIGHFTVRKKKLVCHKWSLAMKHHKQTHMTEQSNSLFVVI